MSEKIEVGCWLLDWWRRTKTDSSMISPKSHKAWMEYVIDINVMAAASRCQSAEGPHDSRVSRDQCASACEHGPLRELVQLLPHTR
jgi:hypothetical protein